MGRSQRPLKGRAGSPESCSGENVTPTTHTHTHTHTPLTHTHTLGRPMLDLEQVMEFADLNSSGLGASVLPNPWGARRTLGTHSLKPGSGPSF